MEKRKEIEEIIKQAVEAGRISAERQARDVYKATERRLYAYPYLKQKLADDREMLEELLAYGPREKSKSIVRFQKSGRRLEPDEIAEALKMDLEATIASDEEEIRTIEKAVGYIREDKYAYCLFGRYFDEKDDEAIAAELECDISTVWRNRKRLVQRVSVMLYGAQAVR